MTYKTPTKDSPTEAIVRLEDIDMLTTDDHRYYSRLYCGGQQNDIQKLIFSHVSCSFELLLKHIHQQRHDEGMFNTLVHKVFFRTDAEISRYVPQLVYIAIRKRGHPMRRVLVTRCKNNEAMRRLVR